MKNLIFKQYDNSYFESCIRLIQITWNLHAGFKGIPDDKAVYAYYLKTCLNWNAHLDIIVDEADNVKGILFGSNEHPSLIRELSFMRTDRKINKWKNELLKRGTFGELDAAKREFAKLTLNDKLGEEDAELFDSEINLFIVSPELKGKGLGRKLMDRYVHFCKTYGIATAFLWTDVDCDYSFYQKYGFKIHKTFKSAKQHHRDAEHQDGLVFFIVIDQV